MKHPMWNKWWIKKTALLVGILGCCHQTFAQDSSESTLRLPPSANAEGTIETTLPKASDQETEKSKYQLSFDFEARSKNDLRADRPGQSSSQSVSEVGIGGNFAPDRNLELTGKVSMRQVNNESTVFVEEAFVRWSPWPEYAELKLGQQFVPVGFLNQEGRDLWFSSNPQFLYNMFMGQNFIDLGAVATAYPFGTRDLALELGQFSGRVVRLEDERSGSPKKPPTVFSLKSERSFYKAFATYFEHNLAFYDPVRAWGAGIELRSPYTNWQVQPLILFERWRIEQLQSLGPKQRSEAWLLIAQASWWRLTGGVRLSQDESTLRFAGSQTALPLETSTVSFFEVTPHKFFRLRYEQVFDQQSEINRDETVLRAIVNATL